MYTTTVLENCYIVKSMNIKFLRYKSKYFVPELFVIMRNKFLWQHLAFCGVWFCRSHDYTWMMKSQQMLTVKQNYAEDQMCLIVPEMESLLCFNDGYNSSQSLKRKEISQIELELVFKLCTLYYCSSLAWQGRFCIFFFCSVWRTMVHVSGIRMRKVKLYCTWLLQMVAWKLFNGWRFTSMTWMWRRTQDIQPCTRQQWQDILTSWWSVKTSTHKTNIPRHINITMIETTYAASVRFIWVYILLWAITTKHERGVQCCRFCQRWVQKLIAKQQTIKPPYIWLLWGR